MTTKVVPGMLIAVQTADDVAREASTRMAKSLREAIEARGSATLALSGGETPKAAYAKLAKEPQIEWSKVHVFWVDERAVPPTDAQSNYRWAKETLLDPAKISDENVHRMGADGKDLEQAAREYQSLLETKVRPGPGGVPSFDVMVLGIGDDGHTASLFPGNAAVDVTDRWVLAIGETPGREPRLTLSAPVIEQARAAFILAVGAKKTPALERVWSTSGTPRETPARIIRNIRGSIQWIIDKAAGGMG